ncbi:MAG: homoserine kinase [Vicinamibacterales bacterium]|nr:homoserine kinase [Vicinamibacterales bacterium]
MLTTIAVPASVANLGPGFDTLAVAVQVYLRVRIVEQKQDGLGTLVVRRADPPVPADNGVERAYQSLAARAPAGLPSLVVDIESEIPIGSGLGSSAAATVAGLRLFEQVVAPLGDDELLAAATALEGHPDNAAAALHGGMVAALQHEDGRVSVAVLEWPRDVRLLIATPARPLATKEARKVVPASYSRADAIFNLQRVARLMHAVATGDADSLGEALKDRWHQPQRAALVPELTPALAIEDPDLLGVCLSGAGPSIVAFARTNRDRIAGKLEAIYRASGTPVTVRDVCAEHPRTVTAAAGARG